MEGSAFCETNQVRQVKVWIVLDFPSKAFAVCSDRQGGFLARRGESPGGDGNRLQPSRLRERGMSLGASTEEMARAAPEEAWRGPAYNLSVTPGQGLC